LDSDLRPGIGSRRPEPWHYRGFAAARNLPLQTPHPGSLRPEPAEVVTAGSQNQEVMVFSGLGWWPKRPMSVFSSSFSGAAPSRFPAHPPRGDRNLPEWPADIPWNRWQQSVGIRSYALPWTRGHSPGDAGWRWECHCI